MRKNALKVLNIGMLVLLFVGFMVELLACSPSFGFMLRKSLGWSSMVLGLSAAALVVAILLAYGAGMKRGYPKLPMGWTMLAAAGAALCVALICYSSLPYRTMIEKLDEELFVDEYGDITGKRLGTYVFNISPENAPVKMYWQCSSITSYGPISCGDEIGEFFIAMESGEVLAVKLDEYVDGVWITVKEFTLDHNIFMVLADERDVEVVASRLDSMPHKIVNLSGMTTEEISQILETATWNALSWTTEKSEETWPKL